MMHLRHLIQAAATAGVLALPTIALAAPDPNSPSNNGPYTNNQCVQWNNNGQCVRWNNQNGNGNNGNDGRWRDRGRGRSGELNGSVSSFSPYNLYLSNGTHVELHNGTVINPTGINLSPGMRVHVSGNWNGDGSFNANQIDVAGRGYRN